MRHALVALGCLGGALAQASPAAAQVFTGLDFGTLPTFARPDVSEPSWDGNFGRVSTGFVVGSSKRSGTLAASTFGFEGGHVWRDGDMLYAISGGVDVFTPFGGTNTPGFGRSTFTQDIAGGIQFKAGTFVRDDVLVYARTGIAAVSGRTRFGASSLSPTFSRSDIAAVGNANVGVEWAVTDRLSLSLEAGVAERSR